jgi:uncharacterized repeat protein (TIGR01451 family)
LSCNFGSLAPNATATVHVTSATGASSCAAYPNTATLSATNSSSVHATATTTVQCPVLTITKTHQVSLTQGQPGIVYAVTVGNSGPATSGPVTVTDLLPTGLSLVSITGNGWTCQTNPTISCLRNDSLGTGLSYSSIYVTVNVAANAPSPVTNQVSVSGGGSITAAASDPATVAVFTCDLNGDSSINVIDIQNIINQALDLTLPVNDLNHDGLVNIADVQKEINAVLGMGCVY